VVTEILSSEVDEEVAVPRIIRSDVKEMFVRKVDVDGGTGGVCWQILNKQRMRVDGCCH
jgi:hypothetical protein